MKRNAIVGAAVLAAGVAAMVTLSRTPSVPSVTLSWQPGELPKVGDTYNVYHATNPAYSAMRLLTNVSGLTITLPATNAAEFFSVRTLRSGIESDWATR